MYSAKASSLLLNGKSSNVHPPLIFNDPPPQPQFTVGERTDPAQEYSSTSGPEDRTDRQLAAYQPHPSSCGGEGINVVT
jgi:hypothetical protein